jgi:D-3-phosphoglycerate dehydrogenase
MRPSILAMPKLPGEAAEVLARTFDLRRMAAEITENVPPEWAATVRGIASPGRDPGLPGRLDGQIFDQLPRLEIIATFSSGSDGIDVDAARARGIVITDAAEQLAEPVADVALGLAIALLRRFADGEALVRSGGWAWASKPEGRALSGRRAGIVGLGRIGKALCRRLEACSMQVGYVGRRPQSVPQRRFENVRELADWADLLFLCCPLNQASRGIIDGRVLEALGPDGLLVNVARGEIVDKEALITALVEERIGGAGLDVHHDEPHVDPRFFSLRNTILLAHLGGATRETRWATYHAMRDALAAHFGMAPMR